MISLKKLLLLISLLFLSSSSIAQTNYALDFDGSNDYVSASSLTYTNNLTMEAWVNWDGQSGSPGIIYNGNSGNSGYGIMLYSGATPSQSITILCGGVAYVTSSTELPTDEWHHIAAVRESGTWKLYFDGVDKSISNSAASPNSPSGSFTIGSVTAGTDPFNGKIDEVRFWSSARSQYDIISTMQLHLDGSETNLEANWRLNDGSGTTATDLVGSYNGTLNNMTNDDWVTSAISFQAIATRTNKALDFDGTNDYVSTGYLPLANSSFTIEFWARQDAASLNNYRMIVSQGTGATNQGLHIGFRSDNKFTFAFYGNDLDVTTATTDTDWHHWACSYDASGNSRKIYQDGKLVASDNPTSDFTGGDKLQIGYNAFSGNNFWDGQIDEVRVWGDERTHAEILSTMNLYLDGSENNLLANWKLDDGSGYTADDLKTVYDGTLQNMTDDDWVISTIPFGNGESHWEQSILAPGNWTTFTNTGVKIKFTTLPEDEIVSVTKISGSPNIVPTDLDDVFDSQYWIINRSSNEPIEGDVELSFAEDLLASDNTYPERICLYTRTENSYSNWSFEKNANYVEATNDYATFNAQSISQQYFNGRISPLEIVSKTPVDGEQDILLNSNFVLNFYRNVYAGSGNIILKKSSDNSIVETITASSCSISNAEVTINPSNDLEVSTLYYIEIENTAFRDANSNYFAGYSSNDDWDFSTFDDFQPTSVSPANNSTDINKDTDLELNFNRDVVAGSGNIYIKKYSDDSIIETIPASNFTFNGIIAKITPSNNYELNTKYYITIDNNAFKDTYYNYFAGYSSKDDWCFATPENLQISTSEPQNNENINNDENLKIWFNRNVSAGTGKISIYRCSDDDLFESLLATECSISGHEVIINPTNDLDENTDYYVLIENTAFNDIYNSDFEGFYAKDDWVFHSNSLVYLTSKAPTNGDYNNAHGDLYLHFNSDVSADVGSIIIKKYSDGTTVETITANSCSISGTDVVINPTNDFEIESTYYVIIENTAFKDGSNNYFPGYSSKDDWNFTILPPLELVSLSPENGKQDVPVNWWGLELTFNRAMNIGSPWILVTTDYLSGCRLCKNSLGPYNAGACSVEGNKVTITTYDYPGDWLNINFYLNIPSGSFYDNYGNSNSSIGWQFKTGTPTPVELTNFNAELINSQVQLNWTTATEVNNYGFQVERKKGKVESETWEEVGFVEGHGNSNSPKDYSYVDSNPINGTSTPLSNQLSYRLKQIDIDGGFEYSDIVEVEIELPTEYKLAQNYPNPFNPSTVINYSIPKAGLVKLNIYNALGEVVAELVNENLEAGFYQQSFNATNLSSGIYFYTITVNEFREVKKMNFVK